MLAFIRDNNTAKSVTEEFDWLYEQLGHDTFTALFQVIITDRGSGEYPKVFAFSIRTLWIKTVSVCPVSLWNRADRYLGVKLTKDAS